jgi:hypothetical protein
VPLFLPSSWEGKEAGSISPASLDLGDGRWACNDLPGKLLCSSKAGAVGVGNRRNAGWWFGQAGACSRLRRRFLYPLPYSRSIFFPFLTLSLEDSLYVHATSLQRGRGSGAENKLGPGRCLDFSFEVS